MRGRVGPPGRVAEGLAVRADPEDQIGEASQDQERAQEGLAGPGQAPGEDRVGVVAAEDPSAGGDPEAVINAEMLPEDVGSMVPSMPGGDGGEHLMGLPLREAREVFEREYLVAQISRFGGNISRTAEFVGMERSALHRKLKALGID